MMLVRETKVCMSTALKMPCHYDPETYERLRVYIKLMNRNAPWFMLDFAVFDDTETCRNINAVSCDNYSIFCVSAYINFQGDKYMNYRTKLVDFASDETLMEIMKLVRNDVFTRRNNLRTLEFFDTGFIEI